MIPAGTDVPLRDCIIQFYSSLPSSLKMSHMMGYNYEEIRSWTKNDCKAFTESGGILEGFELVSESSSSISYIKPGVIIDCDGTLLSGQIEVSFWPDAEGNVEHIDVYYLLDK